MIIIAAYTAGQKKIVFFMKEEKCFYRIRFYPLYLECL